MSASVLVPVVWPDKDANKLMMKPDAVL